MKIKILAQIIGNLLAGLIRTYQLVISPVLAGSCRYQPTCSQYALDAIDLHGPFKGSWLAVRRIARCHPWGSTGFDPVPARKAKIRGKK